jgi:hypothetical protein
LESDRFHNNQEVETAIREWLPLQKPDFYRGGNFKLVPRLGKRMNVFADYVENKGTSVK